MGRLTIEKDVNEMGYLEHLCNMTFPKDGEIWYQDGTTICTLRNLIREFAKKMDIELSDHDDDFDGEMYDNLWFVKDRNTLGLLALLNHALIGYDYLRDRLKKYEDLEEQLMESAEIDIDSMVGEFMHYYNLQKENRLIELPCAVGDTVWILSGTEWKGYDWKWKSYEKAYPSEVKFKLSMLDGMGIDYFATEEEAEAKIENRKRHGIAAKLKELEE